MVMTGDIIKHRKLHGMAVDVVLMLMILCVMYMVQILKNPVQNIQVLIISKQEMFYISIRKHMVSIGLLF